MTLQHSIGYALIVLLPSLGIFSAWRLYVNSCRVYAGLDDIWDRARKAQTRGELQRLHDELGVFYHKYCHVRQYGDYARRVKSYIEGKSAGLPV